MMSSPPGGEQEQQSPRASPPHQYPQEIQLKLYQAFIFSIPILFSIILVLLFYLFYLKRRSANSSFSSTPPPLLPRTTNDATNISIPTLACHDHHEVKLQDDKLWKISFDEYLKARDSLCCVCLGELKVKEEVVQLVASCKHVFHTECIRHWLHNHSTCPLCRAPVVICPHSNSKTLIIMAPENTSESHSPPQYHYPLPAFPTETTA